MAEIRRRERRAALDEFRKGIFGRFVGAAGEGDQRFDVPQHAQPGSNFVAVRAAPAFGRQSRLQRIHHQQQQRRQQRIAPRLDEIDDGGEPGEGVGCAAPMRREPQQKGAQRRGVEVFGLDATEQQRQPLQVLVGALDGGDGLADGSLRT